jgi:hypothetical protein
MRTKSKLLLASLIASCLALGSGFVPRLTLNPFSDYSHGGCCTTRIEAQSDEYTDAVAHNMARTCVRTFLTQRAIQSFMFLLDSCRDPHTVKWFEVSALFKILTTD